MGSLSADWAGENNWCFPPYRLIGLTIIQLQRCHAVSTIVGPLLDPLPFLATPLPQRGQGNPSPHVVAICELGHGHSVLGFPTDSQCGAISERLIVAIRFESRN